MTSKSITLRAFKIKTSSDLFSKSKKPGEALFEKLRSSKTADERRLTLNDRSKTKEQDLIANFVPGSAIKSGVHCMMIRLAIGNFGKPVSEKLLKQESFNLKDLGLSEEDGDGNKVQYQSHFYFFLNNEYLVTNLPANRTVAGLQAYLNWYLNSLYELTPLIDVNLISKLSDVSYVEFQDGRVYKDSIGEDNKKSVLMIAGEYLKGILKDAQTVQDAILTQHISATLKIKIKKPKASETDEVQKTFGALVKPIADLDNVVIYTKGKGKIAKGDEILLKKVVQVEQLQGELLNEPELRQAMELFVQEISPCESTTNV